MRISTDQATIFLQAVLSTAREDLHPDLTVSRLLILLTVVRNPGISQADVAHHVKDLSAAAISRNVLDLSALSSVRDKNGYPLPGPGLIEQRPDPAFRKRNVLYPTPAGLAFLNRLTEAANSRLDRASH